MEPIKIKIENYRNIPLGNPIEFEIKEGISFILGMNNVGKSTLLKFFWEFRRILKHLHSSLGSNAHIDSGGILFDRIVNRKNQTSAIKFELSSAGCTLMVNILPTGADRHTSSFHVNSDFKHPGNQEAIDAFRKNVSSLADTLYFGPFRSAEAAVTGRTGDIEIGQPFINLWNSWAAGNNVDHINKTDLLIDELKELFGFQKFNIKVHDNKSTLLVTTDDGTFNLDELGSGIAQFIVVLGNALIKQASFILIDEPEIGLHPRMQEVFVRALASKAKNGLLASSHSIGLARSTADGTILSLTRLPNGHFELKPFGEHYTPTISQSINELGYSQFIEIGGNNILLVEGRTDVKFFRELLRKFGIETSFIILSLGGSGFITSDSAKTVDELNDLKRLNAKSVTVIFDSERQSPTASLDEKFKNFKTTCEGLGFQVFPTDYHSSENYLSQTALDKVLGGGYTALTPYQEFKSLPKRWDKNKNWLVVREMSKGEFAGNELGKFVQEKLVPLA